MLTRLLCRIVSTLTMDALLAKNERHDRRYTGRGGECQNEGNGKRLKETPFFHLRNSCPDNWHDAHTCLRVLCQREVRANGVNVSARDTGVFTDISPPAPAAVSGPLITVTTSPVHPSRAHDTASCRRACAVNDPDGHVRNDTSGTNLSVLSCLPPPFPTRFSLPAIANHLLHTSFQRLVREIYPRPR